ncbi:oxidoreductase, molybdopterin-binding protein [Brucella sp. NF 2653]|uniref:molybdopterin-binding protein n=1 Tax=unclassified Brucella TaxID=2632610 RepID=UPI0001B476AB|nr:MULTISPECIES: molybdopterin-binding protein [unclassified Brucella]EFM61833.1 oxidoreductase, molybdopterin-binding protein [Brucella sp. NF 2653]
MTGPRLSRRRFLTFTGMAGSAVLLSGCDAFDYLGSDDNAVRQVLEKANDLSYTVQRKLEGPGALAREYGESEIRQGQKPNGETNPSTEEYDRLRENAFADYRLEVHGLVEKPVSFSLEELHNMPARTQITRHDCVEGWSTIAKWTGVPLGHILALAKPKAGAHYVVFHCFDEVDTPQGPDLFYGSIDLIDAQHPQTILAYGLNGSALPVANGAPLRVRVERQLGYKMSKYVKSIELVSSFAAIQGGRGGYWEDQGYDWYGGI